jgi:hypothetical protein
MESFGYLHFEQLRIKLLVPFKIFHQGFRFHSCARHKCFEQSLNRQMAFRINPDFDRLPFLEHLIRTKSELFKLIHLRCVTVDRLAVLGTEPPWCVAILPFMEENAKYIAWARITGFPRGKGDIPTQIDLTDLMPVPGFYCPTRRPGQPYPDTVFHPPLVSKSDYALNAGSSPKPANMHPANPWFGNEWLHVKWPGIWEMVIVPGTTLWVPESNKPIRARQVTDGQSKTYLVGEKAMPADHYTDGSAMGDEGSFYEGGATWGTNCRLAFDAPKHDLAPGDKSYDDGWPWYFALGREYFGSAHSSTWNVVFCDGSVHSLSYNISLATHQALASRAAGDQPDEKEY